MLKFSPNPNPNPNPNHHSTPTRFTRTGEPEAGQEDIGEQPSGHISHYHDSNVSLPWLGSCIRFRPRARRGANGKAHN